MSCTSSGSGVVLRSCFSYWRTSLRRAAMGFFAASRSGLSTSSPSMGEGLAMAMHYTHPFMRKPVQPQSQERQLVDDELAQLGRVHTLLGRGERGTNGDGADLDFDKDLIALRDQL